MYFTAQPSRTSLLLDREKESTQRSIEAPAKKKRRNCTYIQADSAMAIRNLDKQEESVRMAWICFSAIELKRKRKETERGKTSRPWLENNDDRGVESSCGEATAASSSSYSCGKTPSLCRALTSHHHERKPFGVVEILILLLLVCRNTFNRIALSLGGGGGCGC